MEKSGKCNDEKMDGLGLENGAWQITIYMEILGMASWRRTCEKT